MCLNIAKHIMVSANYYNIIVSSKSSIIGKDNMPIPNVYVHKYVCSVIRLLLVNICNSDQLIPLRTC